MEEHSNLNIHSTRHFGKQRPANHLSRSAETVAALAKHTAAWNVFKTSVLTRSLLSGFYAGLQVSTIPHPGINTLCILAPCLGNGLLGHKSTINLIDILNIMLQLSAKGVIQHNLLATCIRSLRRVPQPHSCSPGQDKDVEGDNVLVLSSALFVLVSLTPSLI